MSEDLRAAPKVVGVGVQKESTEAPPEAKTVLDYVLLGLGGAHWSSASGRCPHGGRCRCHDGH